MQTDDAHVVGLHQLLQLIELEQRDAELRMHAGSAHLGVMASALAGIDAHEQLAILEQFRPGLQRVQIVEGHPNALLQGPRIFGTRGEVGREQHAAAVQRGEDAQHMLDLLA